MGDTNDPYSPDYAPEADGESALGDVGSGREFGADLYRLYFAGRVSLPDTATAYEEIANTVYNSRAPLSYVISQGFTELSRVLSAQEDLNFGLARTSQNCHRAGIALVAIANEFARTDDDAAQRFNEYLSGIALGPDESWQRDRLDEAPEPTEPNPHTPTNPPPSSEPPTAYAPPGHARPV